MHNLLIGTDTLERAAKIRGDIINVLGSAGFQLHKWASNSQILIETLSNAPTDTNIATEENEQRVLGIK